MAFIYLPYRHEYIGSSADTLPPLDQGARLYETDTGIEKICNGAAWVEKINKVSVDVENVTATIWAIEGKDAEAAAVTGKPLTIGYKDAAGKATGVTPTNALPVSLSGSLTQDVTFHNAATSAADGTAFTVGGYKTLTVEITRTAGTSTVAFMAEGPSGADIALMGVNITTLATAISTTGTGELWQFDITGLTKVFMDLTAVATGPVTVKGKAVA